MGLANDCTRLDNLRFNIDIHKDRVYDVNELCHRMSHVLVFMSKIVDSKYVKLKCLAAAKTVADEKLADSLATVNYNKRYDSLLQDDPLEDSLMSQLEFFTTAIRQHISFREYYTGHKFISSFDDLVHMNGQFDVTDLRWYKNYPKVERLSLKRPYDEATEDEDEKDNDYDDAEQRRKSAERKSDPTKVNFDIVNAQTQDFNMSISQRFRSILQGSEINGVEFPEDEIPLEKTDEPTEEYKESPAAIDCVKKPFKIVYDVLADEKVADDDTCDCLKISTLCDRRYNLNEIETGMFYFIVEKKFVHSSEDFQALNQNPRYVHKVSNSTHAAIQYLLFKPIPDLSRMMRLKYIFFTPSSALDALIDTYAFEPIPGNQYNFTHISKLLKPRIYTPRPGPSSAKKERQLSIEQSTPIGSPDSTPQPKSQSDKKRLPRKKIANEENFHASDDLLDVFLEIERQLKQLTTGKFVMDASQAMNENSPYKVGFLRAERGFSSLPISIRTLRNQKFTTKGEPAMMRLPCEAKGSVELTIELVDKIVYDELNLPQIQTTEVPSITSGSVRIFGVSHHVKKLSVPVNCGTKQCRLSLSLFGAVRSDTSRRVSLPPSPLKQQDVDQKPQIEQRNAIAENFGECFVKLEPLEPLEMNGSAEQMEIEPDIFNRSERDLFCDSDMMDASKNEGGSGETSRTMSIEISPEFVTNIKLENLITDELKPQVSPGATENDFEDFLTSHTIDISGNVKVEPRDVQEKEEEDEEMPPQSYSPPLPREPTQYRQLLNATNEFSLMKSQVTFDELNDIEKYAAFERNIKKFFPDVNAYAKLICVDIKKNPFANRTDKLHEEKVRLAHCNQQKHSPDSHHSNIFPTQYKYVRDGFVDSYDHLSHLSADALANLDIYDEIDLSNNPPLSSAASSMSPPSLVQSRSSSPTPPASVLPDDEVEACEIIDLDDPLKAEECFYGDVITIDDD